jgi:hypothetical protein
MTQQDAYVMIDRYLRGNLCDDDYAFYSSALDILSTPQAPKEALEPSMSALNTPRHTNVAKDTTNALWSDIVNPSSLYYQLKEPQ